MNQPRDLRTVAATGLTLSLHGEGRAEFLPTGGTDGAAGGPNASGQPAMKSRKEEMKDEK